MSKPQPTIAEIRMSIASVEGIIRIFELGIVDKDYPPAEQAQRAKQARRNLANLKRLLKRRTQ